MKYVSLLIAILAILILPHAASARGSHFPLTLKDDTGHTIRIEARPTRILTLDPRDTETVFAVGAESRLVGDGGQYVEGAAGFDRPFTYPSEWPSRWGRDYPVRSKTLPHIEGGYSASNPFNLETIEGLHPDLVLTLNDPSQSAVYDKMRSLGMTVMILDPANFAGILHDIGLVGKATGEDSHAAAVIAVMKRQYAAVVKAVAHVHGKPRVYYEIDATDPSQPYTAGRGSVISQAIHTIKGQNVGDSTGVCNGRDCYPQVNLETLVSLNPQIILLGDAAYGTTTDSVKSRPGWGTISAVQTGKIYPFDDELISRLGPRFAIGLRAMAKLIHPEAFGG